MILTRGEIRTHKIRNALLPYGLALVCLFVIAFGVSYFSPIAESMIEAVAGMGR